MNIFANAIPDARPADIIAWAEANVKVDGHAFDSLITPQLVEPIRAMVDADTRIGTLIKPVQVGGSTAGEIVLAYWAAFENGLIQFNWQDESAAVKRWHDRILPALNSCKDIKRNNERFEELICLARYINTTVRVQGVFVESALDSDTVPRQINEEVHLWKAGFLSKARRRQTRVWNSKAFDISNASNVGDQLHESYLSGTQEQWDVHCPKCGGWHQMKFRFDPNKPELGGLRWDSDGCKMDGGRFDYNKLEKTIRYQFPCGHTMQDKAHERRTLKGRYTAQNTGAHVTHRSWNFEGVACAEIRWLTLVQEWHSAIRALKAGDGEPMRRFVTERECKFYNDDCVPFSGRVIVNQTLSKSRQGLIGRAARFWFADKQKGYASRGEMTHYWLVIRDVMPNCDSQLVYEGLVQTDADLLARLAEHECSPQSGAVDCGWDRNNVLQFCFRAGANAQTTSAQSQLFYHKADKSYRIHSEPDGLHKQLKIPPKFDYQARLINNAVEYLPRHDEPLHWNIHRVGSIKLLFFLRDHEQTVKRNGGTDWIKWEVPGDVSDDYKKHLESWEFTRRKKATTNQIEEICKQRSEQDHMLMCEAGIANLMGMAPHPDPKYNGLSILSVRLAEMGVEEIVKPAVE